jgi:predicted TIM-barrel fold metal-dependent hydrolase
MTAISPFRKPFGQLVFGGVFDRHPSLKVVFAEGGLCWIPAALQDAEMVFDTFTELLTPMQHRPSHYWHKNCYATFQNDILGLNSIEHIGIDRVMWANDYPHTEGSFGLSWSSMKSVSDIVQSPAHTRLILGDTATTLYGL